MNRNLWGAGLLMLSAGCHTAPAERQFQGYVEGDYLRMAAPTGGQLAELHVDRGDEVTTGTLLFALDLDRELAAVQESQNRGKQGQAALTLAQTQLRRQEDLRKRGLVSAEAIDIALTQSQSAQNRVDELNAAHAQAMWQLAQRRQTAPADAIVDEVYFRPGEFVPAGAPIVSLLPPGNRKIRFFVPETAAGGLRPGQGLSVTCDGCGAPIAAKVSFVSPSAEFTPPIIYSRGQRERLMFMVEARPDPAAAARLHPGQPLDVSLQ